MYKNAIAVAFFCCCVMSGE